MIDAAVRLADVACFELAQFLGVFRDQRGELVFVNGEQLLDNGRFTASTTCTSPDLLRHASDRAKALGRRAGLPPAA